MNASSESTQFEGAKDSSPLLREQKTQHASPPLISIAMATFNGARHIEQQLKSILLQERLPDEMIIGDDGSTDRTIEILEDFQAHAPFSVKIIRHQQRKGYADNFLTTASQCSGQWIMFCDQDDVWLPHKIAHVSQCISDHGDDDLMMVVQSSELADEALRPSGRFLPKIRRIHGLPSGSHFGLWVVQGFCQTVRADLIRGFDWTRRPRGHTSHDQWTCMLANALGKVRYLPGRSALYRRHPSAETGNHLLISFGSRAALRMRGAERYQLLETAALEAGECLRRLSISANSAELSHRLTACADRYQPLSSIFAARAALYESTSFVSALRAIATVAKNGGYFGPQFVRLPPVSLLKDIARVFSI
ncbi:MAG: glycosyltransferase [Mesorhizobium sp.]|uniref:glycosyltransferase n=1 Tax=Mesorhizobium sp. TaxID=1871066 RepID=UPI000FE9DC08|nr:MAG: glycosyltransferase [Mesorhizobium sp.]